MPDPFDVLRLGFEPADPDPAFSSRLRARIARALALPRGVTVSNLDLEIDSEGSGLETETEGLEGTGDAPRPAKQGDVAYLSLWVPDAHKASVFYANVLGWRFGAGGPAESRQIEDIRPHHGIFAVDAPPTLFISYIVPDLDAALARVVEAGGEAEAATVEPYGLTAMCKDNQGMSFALYTPPGGEWPSRWAFNGERHGDVSYVTMHVISSALAREFYGQVLGWSFEPGRVEDGWGPVDVSVMMGMAGGQPAMTSSAMYRVDDIYQAVERVRAGGGTATDVDEQPYGFSSECRDDQGTLFWLGQH